MESPFLYVRKLAFRLMCEFMGEIFDIFPKIFRVIFSKMTIHSSLGIDRFLNDFAQIFNYCSSNQITLNNTFSCSSFIIFPTEKSKFLTAICSRSKSVNPSIQVL